LIPRELIGEAAVPGGPPLRLIRHGRDFIIMLDRNELMSSRMSGSEVALATMTCARLRDPKTARMLVGGYGMGFTLRAALGALGSKARVVVAELVPGILEWARGPMAAMTGDCLDDPRVEVRIEDVGAAIEAGRGSYDAILLDGAGGPMAAMTGDCLDDPRVEVRIEDVGAAIEAGRGSYDAILLDVDNGPDGLTRPGNDGLYSARGLDSARAALRPGGVLAIWSASADAAFTKRLKQAGFAVDEQRVRARENGKGPIHTIWFATKAAGR